MKNIIIIFSVLWNLSFSENGRTWTLEKREMKFSTIKEAQLFVENSPADIFECLNSKSGVNGYCLVSDFQIVEG